MFWIKELELILILGLAGCSWGYPTASGWQDNNIPGSSGSADWQPTSGSTGSAGWQSASSGSGWQASPASSLSTDWKPTGSSKWSSASGSSGWPSGSGSSHNFYDSSVSTDYVSRYHGPIALPVVLPDGTIANTPEVAAARAAHLAALEKAKELWYGPQDDGSYDPHKYEDPHNTHGSSYDESDGWKSKDTSYHSVHTETNGPLNSPYSGPLATPKVLTSGYLEDTPSTEAARAAHLTALWKAQQEAEKWKQGWKH